MSSTPSRYLDEISISGYTSIRELKGFKMSPGLNVLIGANGSGKSNFIRFFELLGHMFDTNKGLQNYVAKRGRADALLFRGTKITQELSAHLKFGLNEYKFTLKPADDRSLFFAQESAPFDGPHHGRSQYDKGSGHLESRISVAPGYAAEKWVVETIRGWRIYHFHDTSPQALVMGPCNSADHHVLHGNAANLAPFLANMARHYPASFAQVTETVRQVAPFFGEFALEDDGAGQTTLLWKDRYSDLLYYPHQLSDGTLRYICLSTLLLQPFPPSTIIIDEPELGLHPYAIKLLVSLLKEAALRCQVIVSTQASLLLDELSPDQVIVVNQNQGESLFDRLDSEKLAVWLQEYTLGQLWEKNLFGGLP